MSRTLVFFLSICVSASASTVRLTLDSAVQMAQARNPELAAARFSIEEARGRLWQSGRRANPELESDIRPHLQGREFSVGVGFVQKFPLTNRLRLEKAVTQAELTAAEAEVQASAHKLAAAVRTVGVKLLSLRESKALKEKQIAHSREWAESARKTAAQGEGSPVEAAQVELEAQQLSVDLLQLEVERVSLVGEARLLLGADPADLIEFNDTLPVPTVPAFRDPDVEVRADYQAAQARLGAARQGIALARAQKWEDLSVGLGAEIERTEDAPDGLETDGVVALRFSLPLPFWNKNEGHIHQAVATAARAEKEAEAVAIGVRAEAVAARGEMEAARRIINEIAGALLPKARELEEKITAFYKQAQPGTQLADVLRSREKRLALDQAKLDALRSYHLARIRFNAAMGR